MEPVERVARASGHWIARIDGRAATDKAALLALVAGALRFPGYFGGNLDALDECLRDLGDYFPAPGYLVLIEHAGEACPGQRSDFEAVVEALNEAGRYWREQRPPKPFRVVVLG
ncbi:MAG: hypothetical protein FD126_1261 [Elusimicrobia bacterium]|nr:MAG: hypothetical protein FD126_1261 [Elusimicrobiota bacterium]